MNRVDHWAEALRLLKEEEEAWGYTTRAGKELRRLRELAQIHATLATIPDSIAGSLDARAKIAGRGDLL